MKRQILILFYGVYYKKMVHYKKALKGDVVYARDIIILWDSGNDVL